MQKVLAIVGLALVVTAIIWVVMSTPEGSALEGFIKTKSGLQYKDLKVGTGAEARQGDKVLVHYTGTLKDGKKFDSSYDRKEPFDFDIGVSKVIKGWHEGVAGMKEGGRRQLVIPPHLGYGAEGAGRTIPPNAELHFDIELLKVVN